MTNGGRTTDGRAASHTREVPKIIYQKTVTTEDLPDYVMGGGARRATFDDQTRQQMSRSVMHMFPKIHEALDPKLPGAMPQNEINEAGSRGGQDGGAGALLSQKLPKYPRGKVVLELV